MKPENKQRKTKHKEKKTESVTASKTLWRRHIGSAGVGRWWRPCPPWSSPPLLAASPKERACHCLPSTVRVNNKQWKVWEVANSSPWCCHNVSILGSQTHPRGPHSPLPPTPSLPLSTSAASLRPDPSPAPETPEGRSPHQPTPPSKKPREGVVPSGTGKPFILGSSLLTDSCVDWKVGCVLYGPRLHQRCGLSVPDLPCLLLGPPSTHHKFKCTNSHPLPPSPPTLTSPHQRSISVVLALPPTALHLASNWGSDIVSHWPSDGA